MNKENEIIEARAHELHDEVFELFILALRAKRYNMIDLCRDIVKAKFCKNDFELVLAGTAAAHIVKCAEEITEKVKEVL